MLSNCCNEKLEQAFKDRLFTIQVCIKCERMFKMQIKSKHIPSVKFKQTLTIKPINKKEIILKRLIEIEKEIYELKSKLYTTD